MDIILKWVVSGGRRLSCSLLVGQAGARSPTVGRPAAEVRRCLSEFVALSQHAGRFLPGDLHLAGVSEGIRLVVGLWHRAVTHRVILAAADLGPHLSARLWVHWLPVVVHLLQPQQELIDHFLVLVGRGTGGVADDPLPLGWDSSVVLRRRCFGAGLRLAQIPKEGSMSELLELLEQQRPRVRVLRRILLALELSELHEVV